MTLRTLDNVTDVDTVGSRSADTGNSFRVSLRLLVTTYLKYLRLETRTFVTLASDNADNLGCADHSQLQLWKAVKLSSGPRLLVRLRVCWQDTGC